MRFDFFAEIFLNPFFLKSIGVVCVRVSISVRKKGTALVAAAIMNEAILRVSASTTSRPRSSTRAPPVDQKAEGSVEAGASGGGSKRPTARIPNDVKNEKSTTLRRSCFLRFVLSYTMIDTYFDNYFFVVVTRARYRQP